jgi:hypothetical protein
MLLGVTFEFLYLVGDKQLPTWTERMLASPLHSYLLGI